MERYRKDDANRKAKGGAHECHYSVKRRAKNGNSHYHESDKYSYTTFDQSSGEPRYSSKALGIRDFTGPKTPDVLHCCIYRSSTTLVSKNSTDEEEVDVLEGYLSHWNDCNANGNDIGDGFRIAIGQKYISCDFLSC